MYKPITKRIFDHPRFKRGSMLFDRHDDGDPKAQVYGEGGEVEVNVDPIVTEGDQIKIEEKVSDGPGACDKYKKGDNLGKDSEACKKYMEHKDVEKKDPCYQYKNGSLECPKGTVLNPAGATGGDRSTCCKEVDKKTCPDGSPIPADGQCKETEKTPGFVGDLYKTMEGTVKQPWQVRQQNRAIKKAGKDVRRAEIKLSKYGIRQPDGTYKMKEGLTPRQQSKFRENLNELGSFQLQAKNIRQDVGTGKIAGQTYYKGQRVMDQAELGGGNNEQAQKEMIQARREYEQSLPNKVVQSENNQADSAIEVEPVKNTFDDVAAEQSRINSMPDFQNNVNTDFGQYKFGNYTPKFGTGVSSGFFKKARPLSKNYFIERSKNK